MKFGLRVKELIRIRGHLLEVPTLGVLVNVGRGNTMGRSESGLVILKVDA